MKKNFKQLAIIGPTASGKSALAIKIAQKLDAYILSIDSLSIYKNIDIVSAKPSKEERGLIKHFGIDALNVDEYFSVDIFIALYKEVKQLCIDEEKNLVIVGGTSFYLKSLLEGLSPLPNITEAIKKEVMHSLENLQDVYETLYNLDAPYMKKISPTDKYRIEKAELIYRASKQTPTEWFQQNPPQAIIQDLDIFNIDVARNILRERITQRTYKMLAEGLIDEVCYLEATYTREPNAMGAIGIVEVLQYLDGKISQEKMLELIIIHTAQLAKRQQTFNKTQFKNLVSAPLKDLEKIILTHYNN